MNFPKIIPVIDLKAEVVVLAAGSDRSRYKLLVSKLTASIDPIDVARTLLKKSESDEIYLADLDAIGGMSPNWLVYREIRPLVNILWVDAGVRTPADALRLRRAGMGVVAGLETVPGLEAWRGIVRAVDAAHVAFSLDLKDGRPIANPANWGCDDALALARVAIESAAEVRAEGLRRLIILDLGRVGTARGVGTELLCERLAQSFPECELIVGGGVHGPDDVRRLGRCGAAGVLVASALHDGVNLAPGH